MKIFFPLTSYYPSQIGGVSNTVFWHIEELEKNNINCSIVCTNIGIKNNEVSLNEFNKTKYGNIYYGKGGMFNLKILFKSFSQVKDNEVIHTNALFDPIGMLTFFFGKIFYPSKLYICSVRGAISDTALSYSPLKKKIALFIYRKLNKNVIFHATSDDEFKNISKVLKTDNKIYLPNYIKTATRIENINVKKKLVFLGRIHPIKRIENLIKAVRMSDKFVKNGFELDIIGTYEERHSWYFSKLKKLTFESNLEDKINFLGHIQGKEKEIKIAESYALVLPSDSENFGNVVIESLNQGTPVIASNKTPWSILPEFEAGFFVGNSPSSLSKTINDFLSISSEKYLNYRKNAIDLVDQKYDIKKNIFKWIKKYQQELN